MSDYIERTGGGTTFTGSDVNIFRALVLASALRIYESTGMKVNAAYTPTTMLKTAGKIVGHTYKRGQYSQAAADLTAWADVQKSLPRNAS